MNHFAIFGLQPRPWIDPEILQSRYLALSTELHPDKTSDSVAKQRNEQHFAKVNLAFKLLQNTRHRLLHLMELLALPKPEHVQDVPAAALDLFPAVAEITRETDELLRAKAAASSPMLQIQLLERGLEHTDKIQQIQSSIRQQIEALERQVQDIDQNWNAEAPDPHAIRVLETTAAALGFLFRWQAQLQERLTALTF